MTGLFGGGVAGAAALTPFASDAIPGVHFLLLDAARVAQVLGPDGAGGGAGADACGGGGAGEGTLTGGSATGMGADSGMVVTGSGSTTAVGTSSV